MSPSENFSDARSFRLQDEVEYELFNDGESNALEYFFIETDTGVIKLKKSLSSGSDTSFSVSHPTGQIPAVVIFLPGGGRGSEIFFQCSCDPQEFERVAPSHQGSEMHESTILMLGICC